MVKKTWHRELQKTSISAAVISNGCYRCWYGKQSCLHQCVVMNCWFIEWLAKLEWLKNCTLCHGIFRWIRGQTVIFMVSVRAIKCLLLLSFLSDTSENQIPSPSACGTTRRSTRSKEPGSWAASACFPTPSTASKTRAVSVSITPFIIITTTNVFSYMSLCMVAIGRSHVIYRVVQEWVQNQEMSRPFSTSLLPLLENQCFLNVLFG